MAQELGKFRAANSHNPAVSWALCARASRVRSIFHIPPRGGSWWLMRTASGLPYLSVHRHRPHRRRKTGYQHCKSFFLVKGWQSVRHAARNIQERSKSTNSVVRHWTHICIRIHKHTQQKKIRNRVKRRHTKGCKDQFIHRKMSAMGRDLQTATLQYKSGSTQREGNRQVCAHLRKYITAYATFKLASPQMPYILGVIYICPQVLTIPPNCHAWPSQQALLTAEPLPSCRGTERQDAYMW
jgi:Tfp pilus assembly protein PilX